MTANVTNTQVGLLQPKGPGFAWKEFSEILDDGHLTDQQALD
jgi:hypothetical protein